MQLPVSFDGFGWRIVEAVNEYDDVAAVFTRVRVLVGVGQGQNLIDPCLARNRVTRHGRFASGRLQESRWPGFGGEVAAP